MAKPSAIAVLPTPGSPIKIGLFFVLLDRTCITLLISSSLPITGSNKPFVAFSVKFAANLLSVSKLDSAILFIAFLSFLNCLIWSYKLLKLILFLFKIYLVWSFSFVNDSNKISWVIYLSPKSTINILAIRSKSIMLLSIFSLALLLVIYG